MDCAATVDITYLKIDKQDLDELWELECHSQSFPMSRENFASCLESPYWGEVQSLSGGYIGFYLCHQVLDECSLIDICVAPYIQHQGFGCHMLVRLLEQAVLRGTKRCLLEVRASNQIAIRMYKKNGFSLDAVRAGYYPAESSREDALLMSKTLI